jgi:hypothetical protein
MKTSHFVPHWVASSLLSAALILAMVGTESTQAANIAPEGEAIMGVNNAIDDDAGRPRFHSGAGSNINDSSSTTRSDNWFGDAGTDLGQAVSFVGVLWTSTRYDQVQSLTLNLATFLDGGWFGTRGIGPAAGGRLAASHLIEPAVQVSTNGGVTWRTVPHTSDYLTVLLGHQIGGGGNVNPSSVTASFVLRTPVSEINGIRIIGENGGAADGNGFIGVFELEVEAQLAADSDADGLPDLWERAHGLVVGTKDADLDPDKDGLTNLEEYAIGASPLLADTDGDTLPDGDEAKVHQTKPSQADSDGDGLNDGLEVKQSKTDPNDADSDDDGQTDGFEVLTLKTDPLAMDSDGDGFADGLEVAQGSDPTKSSSIPGNLALIGIGILGTKPDLDGGVETEVALFHVGTAANISDGNLTTRVDTWNNTTPGTVSFVGIVWDRPMTNPIARLELTLATFFDGGWFGVNARGPGSGGTLTTNFLTEPRVEVSTDDGASWKIVAHTSDYLSALTGHRIGGGTVVNPSSIKSTFTLAQPAVGITGIRIIGTEGGTASGGFIGVFDLAVRTSAPPSTRLENPANANGQYRFDFVSQMGVTYTVQYRASLMSAWQTLATVTGDGTRKQISDPVRDPARFYRISSQ